MEILLNLQHQLIEQFKKQKFYLRNIFQDIQFDNRVTGIVGSRGVGKTSFLLYTVIQKNTDSLNALYVSSDYIYFLENKLIDLVDQLYKETDIRFICIDEIHKYQNWQQELKNIADFYPDFKVLFTGSSMIDIIHSKFDLSRRVTLYHLYGLSFREYLEFSTEQQLPTISMEHLLKNHIDFSHSIKTPQLLKKFKQYLTLGYFPFSHTFNQELLFFQAIENIVQKTIYEDIASLYSMKTSSLLIIEKLFKYVVHSQPGEISAYKLASTLNKDYETVSTYLHYLEQAGLIRSLHKKQSGKAFLKNPIKMYPENTNFVYAFYLSQPSDVLRGKVRETFAINQLQNTGLSVYYSLEGDIEVNDLTFEIGGKNKTRKQLKNTVNSYVLSDDIPIGNKQKIPLYLLGFMG